jgi:tetratricopeptide (TPR) repeat protein
MSSFNEMIAYAPRMMELLYESISQTLSMMQYNLERRQYYLEQKEVIKQIISLAEHVPSTPYPDSGLQSEALSILACLIHLDYSSESSLTLTKQRMKLIDHENNIERLIDILYEVRDTNNPVERIGNNLIKLSYMIEHRVSEEELSDGIKHHMEVELLILDILSSLSEDPVLAKKIFSIRDGYVMKVAHAINFGNDRFDDFWRGNMSKRSDAKHVSIMKIFSPRDPIEHSLLKYKVIHSVPPKQTSSIALLKNLILYCPEIEYKDESHSLVFETLLEAVRDVKDHALIYVNNKEYLEGEDRYTLCLRLLSGAPSNEHVTALMVILYSNRAEMRLQLKKYHEARIDAQKALELDPSHEKSQSRLERANQSLKITSNPFGNIEEGFNFASSSNSRSTTRKPRQKRKN